MTVCFYDTRGGMVGVDKHIYWKQEPKLGKAGYLIGLPSEERHAVGQLHLVHNDEHTSTVTSDGNPMAKRSFSLEYIPHVPITKDLPAALEAVWLAGIIIRSESKPFWHKPTVTGEGAPLATCVLDMIGYNENCDGHGVVINPNSVVTNISLSDLAKVLLGKLVDYVIDTIVSGPIDKLFPPIKIPGAEGEELELENPIAELLKDLFDEHVKEKHIDPVVEPALQEAIDAL